MESATSAQQQETAKRRGFMSRFRRSKKVEFKADTRDQTPSPPLTGPQLSAIREDVCEDVSAHSSMEDRPVLSFQSSRSRVPVRMPLQLEKPPTAREAAFSGPPRYDWIDIETAAAVKVQAVARRNMTMTRLENEGISTAAIRNRARRRHAQKRPKSIMGSADMPNLFACCGVGLAFGDATEEEYEITRMREKQLYEERKKQKEEREEQLRKAYLKKNMAKVKAADKVEEAYEVVE